MINIQDQERLLSEAGKMLKKRLVCFAIGGTAMMFLGLKEYTKDIDLVFLNKEDRKIFKEILIKLGYKEMESRIIYGARENVPEMVFLADWRIDLFLPEVISFIFSENAQKRTVETHEYDNLIIKIADPHDIILMKCATERQKDIDDVESIMKNTAINWNIILDEVKNQMKLGKQRAALDLGLFIEDLEAKGTKIPKDISDELFNVFENQVKDMKKRMKKD